MADKNMEAQISVEFEEATSRQSLNSGETINTLWSKVKRWLSDLKAVAFSGSYNDLSDTPITATKDTDGLMSAEDKSKLDGVATGANKTIVDTILSNTSTNPVQNKVVKQAIDNKADKTVATTSANGLMSAEDKVKLDNADDTYALKSKYGDTTINVGRKAGTIVGHFSTAEGQATTANSLCSHAEGDQTTASGNFSHSEGEQTKAIGVYSHAEGCGTEANGRASHAEGRETTAFGDYSHTSGYYTKALHDNEAAYGKYNESNDNTLFSIGDGTADNARHNAFEITTTGGKLHDKDIATTDLIPTELPANGGNADTVDGKHANDFIYARGYFDNIDLDDIKYPCSGLALDNCTHIPSNVWGTLLVYTGGTGSFTQIYISTEDDAAPPTTMYFRHHGNTRWSDWKEISTTPIKSTELFGITDQSGNLMLWKVTDSKKPIFVAMNMCYAIPFLTSDGTDSYYYAGLIDCTTHEYMINTPVSGTVYYIEL